MTDREKLIALFEKAIARFTVCNSDGKPVTDYPVRMIVEDCDGLLADYLLANGVTFAKDTNVLTNGDRVRAMSDEELAEWNNFCPYPTDECTLKGCTNCIRAWLKQPAQKGDFNG